MSVRHGMIVVTTSPPRQGAQWTRNFPSESWKQSACFTGWATSGCGSLPGINASGTAWRIVIHNVTEWNPEDKFGDPFNSEESCVYSTAGANVFNNDVQMPEDVSRVSVAEAILEAMPSLQRSTPGETGNLDYVRWYAQLLSQVTRLDELPVAHAGYLLR